MTHPEYEPRQEASENEPLFADKLRSLTPGIEFEESPDMLEARMAVLEALAGSNQDSDFLQSVWREYTHVCEQFVDHETQNDTNSQRRAELQIATSVISCDRRR